MLILYTIIKHIEKKIINTFSFIITSMKIKYLGENLTKDVKDFYSETQANINILWINNMKIIILPDTADSM